jgi:UTP--glucose-1-phosphate uridylyltransferase
MSSSASESRGLETQLAALPAATVEALQRYGFDRERLLRQARQLASGSVPDNAVRGHLRAPAEGEIGALPAPGAERERLTKLGRDALAAGHVALVVLAGGMATRMGGIVKALVEALPGRTFLDLRLAEQAAVARRYGQVPPVWLMTSNNTDSAIRQVLGARVDGARIGVFSQFLSLRLTSEGALYLDRKGQPSEYAPGHGDLPDALQQSGLLDPFLARGGRVVMVTNLDNLGSTLDPALIGWHLDHGAPVSCEVVAKLPGDRGGIPVDVDGRIQILEEFRIPNNFDPATVRVFNTNAFHFDAQALRTLQVPWSYFKVTKQVDGVGVIQFERLVNEVTSFVPSRFLLVPRDGEEARFLPVKDHEELARRRDEIESVARARGML